MPQLSWISESSRPILALITKVETGFQIDSISRPWSFASMLKFAEVRLTICVIW